MNLPPFSRQGLLYHPGDEGVRAHAWLGTVPYLMPKFFLVSSVGVYFDRTGFWRGVPVYRQRRR